MHQIKKPGDDNINTYIKEAVSKEFFTKKLLQDDKMILKQ